MNRIALTLAALLTVAAPTIGHTQIAAVPQIMNFSGRLTTPSGNPVADGTYSIRFSLWNAPIAGTEKWNQTLATVQVKNGTFAVALASLPSNAFSTDLWLEIKIGSDAALTPRQTLVTVPYAFKADTVKDGAITSASIAAGSITADKLAPGVNNALSWLLGGNTGNSASNFLGTTDDQPLVFKVSNRRVMRYSYGMNDSSEGALNTLGGLDVNVIGANVIGATIAGGGQESTDSPFTQPNTVLSDFGTIGGGVGNTVNGLYSTIAGGAFNSTGGNYASVGGGIGNIAGTDYATVAGGYLNTANGLFSFAAGRQAKALHNGAFVWGDSIYGDFASTAANQFLVRAAGGVGINTNAPIAALDVNGGALVRGNIYVGDGNSSLSRTGSGATANLIVNSPGTQINGVSFNVNASYNASISGDSIDMYVKNVGLQIWHQITSNSSTRLLYLAPNGEMYLSGQLHQSSDARLKTHIEPLANPLETILKLRGVSYDWKDQTQRSAKRQLGLLAQELETVLPDLVEPDKNGFKTVAYEGVIPVLVEAVKTLKKQNDADRKQKDAEIAELKTQLATLAQAVRQIQNNTK